MSKAILILGESGTGKSASIESLDPAQTAIIKTIDKDLPFKGSSKYNVLCSSNYAKIGNWLQSISKTKPEIKQIILDDFQYVMSIEYMNRALERGFNKFTEIGSHAWSVLNLLDKLRDDITVFVMSHTEIMEDGRTKMKTIGKMLDEKIILEGLFTIVLYTCVENNNYYFLTQNNGNNTCKSPKGMFETVKMPNDLKLVCDAVTAYYSEE